VSARLAPLGLALAGVLLLAAPARAQDRPDWPAPAPPSPGGCVVVVADGSCAPPVVVQIPAPAPVPAPGAYYPYPPAYYPPPYAYPVAPPLRPRSAPVFSAKFWAGPSYERIYGVPMIGADFGVALGAQRGVSAFYGEMNGIVGRTDHGLPTYQLWFGGSWEGTIDRVRLGLGLHAGFLGIGRATSSNMIGGVGIGAFGFASVDLYQSDDGHALYLGARITGNMMDGGQSSAALWGPSASLGYRY